MREHVARLIRGLEVIVTVDEDRRVLRGHSLGMTDGRIVGIWPESAAVTADVIVDGRGKMAIPGLIDCHLHSSFALSRGLADECGAREFLLERMYRYEASLTPEDVTLSSRLAISELLLHGVTTFVDPGNTAPQSTVQAAQELGIRVSVGRSLFDVSTSAFGSVPDNLWQHTDAALKQAVDDVEGFQLSDRIWPNVSFRGVNNASDELIVGLHDIAHENGVKLQTHAAFNYSTRDASVSKHGKTEIQRLADLGVLDESMFLIHAGWLNVDDIELLADGGSGVVMSPSSSLHNGYGNLSHGRHLELMTRGVDLALGSDHASSGLVDLLREAYLLCGYSKEQALDARTFPPEQALEIITRGGAAVAGRPDLGRLEVGGAADVTLIDLKRPEMQPLFNPVSALIYSGSGGLVSDVWVAGQHVVRDRALVTGDIEQLAREVSQFAEGPAVERGFGELVRSQWM